MIIGVIASIAIPTALNQRTQAIEAGMEADLLSTSVSVDLLLTTWRGVPPAETVITTSGTTWTATPASLSSVATGEISDSSNLTGTIWSDGSYCLSITNTATNSTLIYRSDTRDVVPGTCPSAAIGGVGTLPDTITLNLPAMPGGLTTGSSVDNQIDVSWDAVTGATSYTVSVAGVSTQELDASTTSAIFTGIPPGTYTIVVYAQNSNGAGPGAYDSVAVSGSIAYALSSRLGAYTYTVLDQAEKAGIAGQTAGSTVWVADSGWVETWNGSAWIVTAGNLPYGSIARTTSLIIPNNSSTTLVGDEIVQGMTYLNGEFTVQVAGKYMIGFAVSFDNLNNNGERQASVLRNGTVILRSVATPSTTFDVSLSSSRVVTLSAGDVIKLEVLQGSGEDLSLQASDSIPAYMDITYLGP